MALSFIDGEGPFRLSIRFLASLYCLFCLFARSCFFFWRRLKGFCLRSLTWRVLEGNVRPLRSTWQWLVSPKGPFFRRVFFLLPKKKKKPTFPFFWPCLVWVSVSLLAFQSGCQIFVRATNSLRGGQTSLLTVLSGGSVTVRGVVRRSWSRLGLEEGGFMATHFFSLFRQSEWRGLHSLPFFFARR